MKNTLSRTWVGLAAVAAAGLGGAAVAAGAGSSGKTATATTTSSGMPTRPARTPETPLTGDVAAKAEAAAVAKVGGTADAATTENDNSNAAAVYEVHVTKADGSHVTVILDRNDHVLDVESGDGFGGRGHGPGGHGGPGGNGETDLTGDTATQAKAAAVAKVGGTADRATTENDSSNSAAEYEVHVAEADGTHVTVIEDANYSVLSVETGPSFRP